MTTLIKLFATIGLFFIGMQAISTGTTAMSYGNTFILFGGFTLLIFGPIACVIGLWYLWRVNNLVDKLKGEENEKVGSK